jgi:hypothetical protein
LKRDRFLFSSLILLIVVFLTGCSEEKAYEVIKSDKKITESVDKIQLEFDYEIANHSSEDCYFTFVFPSYIQDALITKVGIGKIPANSSVSGVAVVAVSKDGAEMSEETIEAIINGDLPFVQQILIGKTLSLN